MEFKGTPGRWRISKDGTEITSSQYPFLRSHESICDMSLSGKSYEKVKANAQIISKAPEMLACIDDLLKELAFNGYTNSTAINNAKELIKEATCS